MKYFNNKILAAFSAVALMLSVSSCDFGDTNIDPTNPSPDLISADLALPAAQAQTVFNLGALGGRMPGIVIQHFSGFDAQQVAYTDYVIEESDLNNLWVTGLYSGAIRDADIIIQKGVEDENPFYEGVGKILMATSLGLTTTFWGDIPYSEALQGVDNLTPSYDTQESVYAAMQTLLDEAIVNLSAASFPTTGGDIIYNGDAAAWVRVANSLKARFHMHLSRRNSNYATDALNAITAGALTSNAEIPYLTFDEANTGSNPYAQFGDQRPKTMIIAPSFATLMTGDPRQSLYMVADGSEFLFFEDTDATSTNLFWSANSSPLPIISYTEVKFIEAEAQLANGAATPARTALQEAIEANMDQLGLAAAAYAGYVTSTMAAYDAATTDAARLEVIIGEKYKAMFAQSSYEAWSDYRRTGYPALTASPNGANGVNPSGIIPRRFLYPISERQFNDASRQAAIDVQGGHLLDNDVWAFQ